MKATEEARNFIPVEFEGLRSKTQSRSEELKESSSFVSKLQVMERMVVQNATMGVTMDFKYWNDPADQYQEEGEAI